MSVEAARYSEGKNKIHLLVSLYSVWAIFASKAEALWGAALCYQFHLRRNTQQLEKLHWVTSESVLISDLLRRKGMQVAYICEERGLVCSVSLYAGKLNLSSEILCSIVQVPLKPFSPFAVASSRLQRLDNSTVRTYSCWQATQRRRHWLAVSSFPWLTKDKPPWTSHSTQYSCSLVRPSSTEVREPLWTAET